VLPHTQETQETQETQDQYTPPSMFCVLRNVTADNQFIFPTYTIAQDDHIASDTNDCHLITSTLEAAQVALGPLATPTSLIARSSSSHTPMTDYP